MKRAARVFRGRTVPEGVLTCADGTLTITLGGASVTLDAEGGLVGEARLAGESLIRLSRMLPEGDPVSLTVTGRHLSINNFRIACDWQPARRRTIELPIDADYLAILRTVLVNDPNEIERAGLGPIVGAVEPTFPFFVLARLRYDPAEIKTAGLSRPVNEAWRKSGLLLRRAKEALEPFGVTEEEVRDLATKGLMRATKGAPVRRRR